MKLKYYLKGLGTGILFSSVILSISFAVYNRQNERKTQDEIIAGALAAGMIWPEETTTEKTTPEETTTEKTTPEETTTEKATPEETTTETTTQEETTTAGETKTPVKKDYEASVIYKDSEKVKIQILKGMNSYDVAIILEKAGILGGYAEREAFNDYIVAQGYGRFVMVGIFEIPVNATYDEIISIVCKK